MVQLVSPINNNTIASSPYLPSSSQKPLFIISIKVISSPHICHCERPNRTHNFNNFNDIYTDEEAFGSRKTGTRKRIWWSDVDFFDEDEDDDEDKDEDEDDFLDSINGAFSWIPKVLRAFGWMVPAVLISMLLGTGTNALFMALVLPLAQSAVSLVVDTLWNSEKDNPRPMPRRTKRRRSYPRAAATDVASSQERKVKNVANEGNATTGEKKKPNFGGWDELDKQRRSEKVPLTTQIQKVNGGSRQKSGKFSRKVVKRDKPLVLRLLIAVFPFLGSWAKLL